MEGNYEIRVDMAAPDASTRSCKAGDSPEFLPACEILRPETQSLPLVFASPHSGAHYPPDFLAASRLTPLILRKSEDCFVDEIFATAIVQGAPLLRANFPRAYVDPNREEFELDPHMFTDALPEYINTRSPRVVAGLGTIARIVASGEEIYAGKLSFKEVVARLNRFYHPYHQALRELVEATRDLFGYCILVDCHSMPSVGNAQDRDAGIRRVDFVLGDRHGTSCAAAITRTAEESLTGLGYVVARNAPYSGGFTTSHYGRPENGIHCLQIEINRQLYMDEIMIERRPGLDLLSAQMEGVIAALGTIDPR